MLIRVKMLDYHGAYAYAPPQVDAVINTDDVTSARPTEARGIGPFLAVNMRDGSSVTIVGTVEDLLSELEKEGGGS
jgi:hypothetical protein